MEEETRKAIEFDWHTRPRPPERIPVVLGALQSLWLKHPDLRLGQLVHAVCPPVGLFHTEDDEWLRALEGYDEEYQTTPPTTAPTR